VTHSTIYRLADGSFAADRDHEFRNAQLFQVVGASVMLLAGAAILATLAHHRAKSSSRIVSVLAAVATAAMMLGYLEVIRQSGSGYQSC
jgi:apolipoprotein N-acyltransferase